MEQKFSTILISLMVLFVWGCNKVDQTADPHALDGVKLISPAIQDEYAAESMGQERYELRRDRRLLLRFEKLKDKLTRIQSGTDHPLELELTLDQSENAARAQTDLKLYPLTKTWMMRATWSYAHPFFWPEGLWESPGGDFRQEEEISVGSVNGAKVRFDVTSWFQSYPLQGMNYGLLLTSDSDLVIFGDGSQAGSPRLYWTETGGTIEL